MRRSLLALAVLAAGPAIAEGFAIQDPGKVEIDGTAFAGGTYSTAVVEGGLIIFCETCEDDTQISIEWSDAPNAFMTAYLSGQTTLEALDAQCKANVAGCTIEDYRYGPAVGWKMSSAEGTEVVLFKTPQILALRSDAPTPDLAATNLDAALTSLIPQIVGPDQ